MSAQLRMSVLTRARLHLNPILSFIHVVKCTPLCLGVKNVAAKWRRDRELRCKKDLVPQRSF